MMIIVVNPAASGGKGLRKWREIEPAVHERVGAAQVLVAASRSSAEAAVRTALLAGETDFVAAGGDGTVNLLVQAIMELGAQSLLGSVRLGAIGLGSSNDFHKPFRQDRLVRNVPVRLDFT